LTTKPPGAKALALLVGSALVLSACATSNDSEGEATSTETSNERSTTAPVTINLGYAQEFNSYNNNTTEANALKNTVVLNQVLRGFYYFAPDGSLVRDTEFGTFEKTSDDPLTVEYSFNEDAVWSDGDPIDCDDAVAHWLTQSNVTGEKGFLPATTAGYVQMEKPQCEDGDKDFTIVYEEPFADWEAVYGSTAIMPAHILEKQGGVADIIAAADKPTDPSLATAIAFWNTGWALNPGELKPEIMPSAGPYVIDNWTAGNSLTLKPNSEWWGTPPASETIVVKFIADDQQTQALENGELNIMEPQPQVDLVKQLEALGDAVDVQSGDQYSFEHIDYNFKTVFADKKVREAFAKCLPREQIVNNLVRPQNPNADILQSRFIFPFQPEYADFEEGVGGQNYNEVDIAAAKALLEEAGKVGTPVRVGWNKNPQAPNQRRVDTVALIKASCDQAGFDIQDAGVATFFDKELSAGQWDVALFAWIGSPTVSGDPPIYQTKAGGKGGQNNGQYSNPEVDKLLDELVRELDKDKQTEIRKQVDTILWTDLATIPLFPFPGLLATDTKVKNVELNSTNADVTWNAFDWSLDAA
jgi:peptide/nickel transport system substrate-binding protein